ncbi:MAG: recombinase family protein [Armatimonadota bacterium]
MYARMSTEYQQYSTENQCDVIREYAAKNNMNVVHIYTDGGNSGLQINWRNSLKQLIDDVNTPNHA